MKKKYFWMLLFLQCSLIGFSQKYSREDIDEMISSTEKYSESNPTLSIKMSDDIYAFSEAIGYQKGMMLSAIRIASSYTEMSVSGKAIEYAKKAEALARATKNNKFIAIAIKHQAIAQVDLMNYEQARQMIRNALPYAEKIEDINQRHTTTGSLYQTLSSIYYYDEKASLDSAVIYNRKSIESYIKIQPLKSRNIALDGAFVNLGDNFLEMKQLDSATHYLQKGLKLSVENDAKFNEFQALFSLGRVHYAKQEYQKAIEYYEEAVEKAKAYKNFNVVKSIYYDMGGAYEKLENFQKATYYVSKYRTLNDSLERRQRVATNKIMNVIVEDNEAVSKKKQTLLVSVILGIVVLFVFFRLYQRYQKKKKALETKKHMQQLEYKALKAQMNPHFIFNVLNNMQSIIILKGEAEVNKYFVAFSRLLRITLDMSNKDSVSLKEEIEYLDNYMLLNNLQFNEQLEYSIDIDNEIGNLEDIYIPGMLIQPFVENAILHGLAPKKNDKRLQLKFIIENQHLVITIEDNGVGRLVAGQKKQQNKNTYKSWSTTIVNERIKIINAENKKSVQLEILDLFEEEKPVGTKVVLKFKIFR